ncbi:MAG: PASTA domain-containing protein [Vicinamibacterales bacterium]
MRTASMAISSLTAVRHVRSLPIGFLIALLVGMTVATASAETLMMPKRDMLRGTSQVVWGVTTLPNHVATAPTTYSINFGDGTPNATGNVTDRSYIAVNHTYDAAGTFTATLQVTRAGTTESASVEIRVFDGSVITPEQLRGVRINSAIEDGLRYLWVNQNSRAANFPNAVTTSWVAHSTQSFTALVVLAFENHNYRLDNSDAAPTGLYEKYVVRRGLNFVIDELRQVSLTTLPGKDPCVEVEPAPCVGLRQNQQSEGYATSLAILPLAASNALNRHVSEITGADNAGFVVGKTYKEILQRLVNALSWGQGDTGIGRGGWTYSFHGGNIDGSTIGWNVLALLDAAAAGITVPAFVKTEFATYAIPTSLNTDGTWDYGGDGNPAFNNIRNMVKAGVALQALFYADIIGLGDSRVLASRNAANLRWLAQPSGDSYPCGNGHNKGCAYAMFNVFKGLKLQGVTTLPNVTRPAGPGNIPASDWYADYVDWLLTNQSAPTTLTGGDWPTLNFSCCDGSTGPASAAMAELILSNVALISPDPTLFATVGLAPVTALLSPGGTHTVIATATSAGGAPVPGVTINFKVLTGPNADAAGEAVTNAAGQATFTYTGIGGAGRDTIQAFIGTLGSNLVEAIWQVPNCNPTSLSVALATPLFPLDQGWRAFSVNGAPGATITQVCQDELPNFENIASWAIDADGVGTSAASIRAQRSGTRTAPGNGRVYHIYFTSSACTGQVTLGVPATAGGSAVDDGPRYNSVTGAPCAVPTIPAVVAAPNIVGDTQSGATTKLATAGLQVGLVSQLNHPSIPAGVVMSQAPAAGINVAAGSAVAMTVSSGPSSVAVPNVVGAPQSTATSNITGAGLAVSINEVNDPSIAAGLVMSQSPIGGTQVAPGSSVVLTVSLGVAITTVPNLVGLPLQGAVSTVGGAGLNFGTVDLVHHATIADGRVISQSPAPGSVVAPGSFVDFVISLGPSPVPVPNVVGQTQGAAEASLVAASLTLGTVAFANDSIAPPGQVISQAPNAGLTAAPGSKVNVTLSLGPVMIGVPSVVGLANVTAQTTIVGAGLAVGSLTMAYDAVVPVGSVLNQSPAGGVSAPLGSAVNLTISKGPAPVTVPNLVGQGEGAATASLAAATLVVGTISRTNSATVPLGIVMGQNPFAGSPVPAGTAVNLLVSDGPVMVTVPNVVGALKDAAMSTVLGAKLSVSVNYAASATVPLHAIISQNPAAGTSVPLGSFVDLIASSGPTIGVVPNVIGQTEADAGLALTAASLTTGTITLMNSPTVPAGRVISQNPAPGSTVPVNSAVALTVSQGPVMVTVPAVVGDTDTVAKQKILAANLGYDLTYRADLVVPAHGIISQDPAAGQSVPIGTMVNIVGSSGPTVTVVPHVVGLQRAAAETAITTAGLSVGPVTLTSHATVPAGAVISQTPAGGSNSAAGVEVSLVVSVGPPVPTVVPNVVGQPRAEAEQALTAAGFSIGTVTQLNDSLIPLGAILSQTPAGSSTALRGSAVDLVESLGSFIPGVPHALDLQLSTQVVSSGAAIGVTSVVTDGFGTLVTPTPPITYEIVPSANSRGPLPILTDGQLSTGADTRGSYTLRGTVDGTGIVVGRPFVVLNGAPKAVNAAKLVKLATAEATIAKAVGDLYSAYQTPGTPADAAAARTALADALLTVPVTGRQSIRRSTVLAPEVGFLPSLSQVTAAGYPLTPGDSAFGNLIGQINAKLIQITAFYNNLNPDGTVGSGDSVAQLNTLNAELAALQAQLGSINVTPHGIVRYASQINALMSHTIPLHLHAVTNRLISVSLQYPDPGAVPAGVARMEGTAKFFAALKGAPQVITPGAFYGRTQPAFFFLLGMFGGSSIQMQMIQKMYGEVMHEVDQMIGVLVAHGILSMFISTGVGDLVSGASLSFHVPLRPGSTIEGYGFGTSPTDNETWFIGPQAFQAVEDLVKEVKDAFTNLHDSIEECLDAAAQGQAAFCDTDAVDDFFGKIDGAISATQEAYDNAHTQPTAVTYGCILDDSSGCQSLVFGTGFPDVNTTRFPSPVIVLHRNWIGGGWGLGIFNFIP